MPTNPNDLDYSFWNRTRGPNTQIPDLYREQHERERKALRHELTKTLAVKPLSCRDSHGNYRGSKGELLDPAALYHLGIEVPTPVPIEPGEPDWRLDVDPRRPLIGDLVQLSVPLIGKRPFLQLFKYTKAGRIPDGPPQSIRNGRLRSGASIYACDHQPAPEIPQPYFMDPDRYLMESQLHSQNSYPDQFAYLDPELVAQVLPHPHARFLPDARPYPWGTPADLPPVLADAWRRDRDPQPATPNAPAKPNETATLSRPASHPCQEASNLSKSFESESTSHQAPPPSLSEPSQSDYTPKPKKSVFTPSIEHPLEPPHPPRPESLSEMPPSSLSVRFAGLLRPQPAAHASTETESVGKPRFVRDLFVSQTPDLAANQRELLRLVSLGVPPTMALRKCRISPDTCNEWLQRQHGFRQDLIDARNHYAESVCSDLDSIHDGVRETIKLWLQSADLSDAQRLRIAKLILKASHSPHLIPRRLAKLMPHNISDQDGPLPNTEHTFKPEKSVFTPTKPEKPQAEQAEKAHPPFRPEQQQVLDLVEQGHSIVTAMNKMELARDTFYTWRKRNPAFRQAVLEARDRYCERIAGEMDRLTNRARQEIEDCIHNDDAPISVRIGAIEFFLRHLHTDILLPRTLQELIPYSLAQWSHAEDSPQTTSEPNRILAKGSTLSRFTPCESLSVQPTAQATPEQRLDSQPTASQTPISEDIRGESGASLKPATTERHPPQKPNASPHRNQRSNRRHSQNQIRNEDIGASEAGRQGYGK